MANNKLAFKDCFNWPSSWLRRGDGVSAISAKISSATVAGGKWQRGQMFSSVRFSCQAE